MQDPVRELPGLINALLQAPADRQRELIERYYAPECKLTHALLVANNREEIIAVFQYWRFATRRLRAQIEEIVLDGSGGKVVVQFVQHIEGFQHTPLTFHLSMTALLYLRPAPGGRWVIAKQVDYHSFESILYHSPLTGWLLRGVRAAVGAAIIGGTQLAGSLWPSVEPLFQALPCSDVVGDLAARLWWKRGGRGGPEDGAENGGILEPYDPHK